MIKENGYDIYFRHIPDEVGFTTKELEGGRVLTTPYRGMTTCIVEKDGETIAEESAFCSVFDRFEKSKGRKLSLARAISRFPREFRQKVWENYHKTTKS